MNRVVDKCCNEDFNGYCLLENPIIECPYLKDGQNNCEAYNFDR